MGYLKKNKELISPMNLGCPIKSEKLAITWPHLMIKSEKNLVASLNAVDCVVSMIFKGDYAGHFVHTFRYLGTTSKTDERIMSPLEGCILPCYLQTLYLRANQYWLKIHVKFSKKIYGKFGKFRKIRGFEILCLKNWGKIIWGK